MGHCTFCDILTGDLPASIVHEDDKCCAFMDIHPLNTGHVLVIPNTHAAGLADLDPDIGAHLFRVAQQIAIALRHSDIPCQGISLSLADGRTAGQEVFHVHLHVIPRTEGDGLGWRRFGTPPGAWPHRMQLDMVAQEIRDYLD